MNEVPFIFKFVVLYGIWFVVCFLTGLVYAIYARRCDPGDRYQFQEGCKFFLTSAFVPIWNVIFGCICLIGGVFAVIQSLIHWIATGENPFAKFGEIIR